jgi:hypothetical protein
MTWDLKLLVEDAVADWKRSRGDDTGGIKFQTTLVIRDRTVGSRRSMAEFDVEEVVMSGADLDRSLEFLTQSQGTTKSIDVLCSDTRELWRVLLADVLRLKRKRRGGKVAIPWSAFKLVATVGLAVREAA